MTRGIRTFHTTCGPFRYFGTLVAEASPDGYDCWAESLQGTREDTHMLPCWPVAVPCLSRGTETECFDALEQAAVAACVVDAVSQGWNPAERLTRQ